jgi:3-hydroxybutyryl-CoA dehydrogenase
MQIQIFCSDEQWSIVQSMPNVLDWVRVSSPGNFSKEANAIFIMDDFEALPDVMPDAPLFFNDPIGTQNDYYIGEKVYRFCGWPGFFGGPAWEVSGKIDSAIIELASACGKKIIPVNDKPGMTGPRIVSMIINEAYFALEAGVSSKKEIDIAMKLGTNYPFGPFEWSEKIGLKKIITLLDTLSVSDSRYTPSSLMKKEMNSL